MVPSHLEGAFLQVFELPTAQQQSALSMLCEQHPEHATVLRHEARLLIALLQSGVEQIEALSELHARFPHFGELARGPEIADPPAGASAGITNTEERLRRLQARPPFPSDRYDVRGHIGRGGMGDVLRVHDHDLRRNLAMKVMREPDGAAPSSMQRNLARFLDEAQIIGQLDHPGIVPLHDLGLNAQGRACFTMKLVRGDTAEEVFAKCRDGKDGWTRTRGIEVIIKVCDTMAFAHQKGIVHRDLKPTNVMVGQFGEVYVMDWGLAKVSDAPDKFDLRIRPEEDDACSPLESGSAAEHESGSPLITIDGTVLGTPCFMAPEQANGQVEAMSARSDVYSVGAMLYQLLTGRTPYIEPGTPSSSRQILSWVRERAPTPIHAVANDVPAELAAICDKAMARAPEQRYADMTALAGDLRAYLEHRVVAAYSSGAWVELRLWVQRNRGMAVGVAAAALALALGAVGTGVFAVRASEHAQAAKAQSIRSEGLRLAAQSRAELERDPSLALLLGVEAAERHRGPEALNAVQSALVSCRELRTIPAHSQLIEQAFFSPDGRRILTCSIDHTARVSDVATGECLFVLTGHRERASCARFTHNGRWILTSSFDGTAMLWDAMTGAHVRTFAGHTDWVNYIAISPDDRLLLTCSRDHRAGVFEIESGRHLGWLPHGDRVLHGQFNPVHPVLVTGCEDGTIWLWDTVTWQTKARIQVASGGVRSAIFSPDGSLLSTTSTESTARLWTWSGEHLRDFVGHTASVGACNFSPDRKRVITNSRDGTARIWTIVGDTSPLVLRHESAVGPTEFSPDGQRVISGCADGTSFLWDAQSGTLLAALRGHQQQVQAAHFSADGTTALTASVEVRLWDVGPSPGAFTGHGSPVLTACFGRSKHRIVSGAANGTVVSWDREGGPAITLQAHQGDVLAVLLTDDDRTVVTYGSDRFLRVWDYGEAALALRKELHVHETRSPATWAIARDGRRAAFGFDDGTLEIWEVGATKPREWQAHTSRVLSIAFDPDGIRLLTSGLDFSTRLWDAAGGMLLCEYLGPRFTHAVFSPDGARIAVTDLLRVDSSIVMLDANSLHATELPAGRIAGVRELSFSPDGRMVAVASDDHAAHLFDARTGTEVMTLRGHRGQVSSVSFSADGQWLVTTSTDQTVRSWPLDPLPHARKRRPREFTLAERIKYDLLTVEEASAMPIVAQRFQLLRLRDLVLEDLQRHRQRMGASFEAAMHLAQAWPQASSSKIGIEALGIALQPGLPRSQYELAARWSGSSVEVERDGNMITALGIAQYRLGDYLNSVLTLSKTREIDQISVRVSGLAYLARAHEQLGNAGEAAAARDSLTEILDSAPPPLSRVLRQIVDDSRR